MLSALASLSNTGVILTGSNADPGGQDIDKMLKGFADEHEHAVYAKSLGSARFISVLSEVDAIVGNSSSGLYEAPSVKTPTVNIGDRQKGRLRASSVFDCQPTEAAVLSTLREALAADVSEVVSPYGDGSAAAQIAAALKSTDISKLLSQKRFVDLDSDTSHE
jgi:UDP-N-acetylglucosamine 2-epimerase